MVKGNLITPGTQVLIDSAFHLDALEDRETPLRMTLAMLQRLPLIGCLMAHGLAFTGLPSKALALARATGSMSDGIKALDELSAGSQMIHKFAPRYILLLFKS